MLEQHPTGFDIRRRADHPVHVGERQVVEELRIACVAVHDGDAFLPPSGQRFRIEVDADHPAIPQEQVPDDAAAIPAKPEDHDVSLRLRAGVRAGLAKRRAPLEDTKPRRQPLVQGGRIDDHVRGQRDRDQPDGRNEPHRLGAQMTDTHAQGTEDQREFADLCHRKSREEAGSLPISHHPHDDHHDDGISDQHERR